MLSRSLWLALVFLGVFIQSAEAGGRRGGRVVYYYPQQSAQTQYYYPQQQTYQQPTAAATPSWSSRAGDKGHRVDYNAGLDSTSSQRYGQSANSQCVHGPNGTVCNHDYKVRRDYDYEVGGQPQGYGTIRYNGEQGNRYSHYGTRGEIEAIDRVEQRNAEENRTRMKGLGDIAEIKATFELRKQEMTTMLNNGQISAVQRAEYFTVVNAYQSTVDQLAAGLQTNNANQREVNVRQALKWGTYALSQHLAYLDKWQRNDRDYNTKREEMYRAYLAFAILAAAFP